MHSALQTSHLSPSYSFGLEMAFLVACHVFHSGAVFAPCHDKALRLTCSVVSEIAVCGELLLCFGPVSRQKAVVGAHCRAELLALQLGIRSPLRYLFELTYFN